MGWNLLASFLNASLISLSVADRLTPRADPITSQHGGIAARQSQFTANPMVGSPIAQTATVGSRSRTDCTIRVEDIAADCNVQPLGLSLGSYECRAERQPTAQGWRDLRQQQIARKNIPVSVDVPSTDCNIGFPRPIAWVRRRDRFRLTPSFSRHLEGAWTLSRAIGTVRQPHVCCETKLEDEHLIQ